MVLEWSGVYCLHGGMGKDHSRISHRRILFHNIYIICARITFITFDITSLCYRIKLDGQCKKWRLFADILNDVAMGMELLVPYFLSYSVVILCISTIMKAIVGVAGGATRAALTQHQVNNH